MVGDDPGESKLNKAKQMGVQQVDEDGFFDLIKSLSTDILPATPSAQAASSVPATQVESSSHSSLAASASMPTGRKSVSAGSSPALSKGKALQSAATISPPSTGPAS